MKISWGSTGEDGKALIYMKAIDTCVKKVGSAMYNIVWGCLTYSYQLLNL